ncbi:MAG: hypothetical protein PVJ57_21680 [Phycisphaerae bacterium]
MLTTSESLSPAQPTPVLPRTRWRRTADCLAATTLLLLLAHVLYYRFMCDDAYISFRYVQNLVNGHGLVFNPGRPPVEGYTNFLWVILLSIPAALGIAPEYTANVLSIAATVLLWGALAWYAYHHVPPTAPRWLVLVPLGLLAITRSVAVWATSGLETRWFELLVVAGVLRQLVELQRLLAQRGARPVAALLLALASLTRPDGVLIALLVTGGAFAVLLVYRRANLRYCLAHGGTLALLVGAQACFRLYYYGDWLPNTYYAKVDGQTWWSVGGAYLTTAALEYAAYLWVPLVVAGIVHAIRQHRAATPVLLLLVVGGHALYIASIGGDHFEFRPLTLYFPLLYLLVFEGACLISGHKWWRQAVVALYLLVVAAGITWLPAQMHLRYRGLLHGAGTIAPWWPDEDPLYRWWPLRAAGEQYCACSAYVRACAANIRQEEHAALLHDLRDEGLRLASLVEEGRLPRDTQIALDGVGAIPYFSGLPTLDRLGLNDREVARQPFLSQRLVAHGKRATLAHARKQGVDLWAQGPTHLLMRITDPAWPRWVQASLRSDPRAADAPYVADAGEGWYFLVVLPQRAPAARARFPAFDFQPLATPRTQNLILTEATDALRTRHAEAPEDVEAALTLVQFLLMKRKHNEAAAVAQEALQHREDLRLWLQLCYIHLRNRATGEARQATERALMLARQRRDTQLIERLTAQLRKLDRAP